ncbi:MAG: type II toxin-antitoxin system VapC family toxin [Pseudomonadota bacterium]
MILLDTHALIWFAEDSPRLGARAVRLADAALHGNRLAVSAFSFWELTMLVAKERVKTSDPPHAVRRTALAQGIREILVDGALAIAAAGLPDFRGDPADRIIVATALSLQATLLTADGRVLAWRGGLRTHDARH